MRKSRSAWLNKKLKSGKDSIECHLVKTDYFSKDIFINLSLFRNQLNSVPVDNLYRNLTTDVLS